MDDEPRPDSGGNYQGPGLKAIVEDKPASPPIKITADQNTPPSADQALINRATKVGSENKRAPKPPQAPVTEPGSTVPGDTPKPEPINPQPPAPKTLWQRIIDWF